MKQFAQSVIIFFIIILFGCFFVNQANAATLTNLKDTITTSRPSASSPITANAASGVGQLSIANNGSRYLASDSAKVIRNNAALITQGAIVSSQSAALTTVFFGNTTGAAVQNGTDTLIVPITAKHTISFQIVQTIPIGGVITVTFPGSANNTASPSASTFAFNALAASDVTISGSGCATGAITVSSPTISCTTTAAYTGGTTITITIGATPILINPTKSAVAGTNDSWTITVATTNGTDPLDSSFTKVATIESVQVQATVEPYLTFIISGLSNGSNINTISASCGSIATNAGITPTATSVNLGVLSSAYVSNAAQQLLVSTNAAVGYVITATSSGQFKNTSTGAIILDANGGNSLTANDTPVPATIAAGTAAFGIHACGARSGALSAGSGIAAGDIWVNAGTITTAKFSNPWNTGTNAFYNTIASYTGGGVDQDKTAVLYGATISGTTPAGIYQTTLTYVATGTF